MRANKDYSKASIDCWFMHSCCSHKVRALYKPEILCMHFFRPMFYNVDALLLLSTQISVEIDNISGSAKSQ